MFKSSCMVQNFIVHKRYDEKLHFQDRMLHPLQIVLLGIKLKCGPGWCCSNPLHQRVMVQFPLKAPGLKVWIPAPGGNVSLSSLVLPSLLSTIPKINEKKNKPQVMIQKSEVWRCSYHGKLRFFNHESKIPYLKSKLNILFVFFPVACLFLMFISINYKIFWLFLIFFSLNMLQRSVALD